MGQERLGGTCLASMKSTCGQKPRCQQHSSNRHPSAQWQANRTQKQHHHSNKLPASMRCFHQVSGISLCETSFLVSRTLQCARAFTGCAPTCEASGGKPADMFDTAHAQHNEVRTTINSNDELCLRNSWRELPARRSRHEDLRIVSSVSVVAPQSSRATGRERERERQTARGQQSSWLVNIIVLCSGHLAKQIS